MDSIESREVYKKLLKGLLDIVILDNIKTQPTQSAYGYQIIAAVRKGFDAYFGPSTIYPLLNAFEKKGYIKSRWDVEKRPKKVYTLTEKGENLLSYSEGSLDQILKKIGIGPYKDTGLVVPLEQEPSATIVTHPK